MTVLANWWRSEFEKIDPAPAEVIVALPDLYGRLVGSRVTSAFFLSNVIENGLPACDYLLACDVDMVTLDGGEAGGPGARSYGDMSLFPVKGSMRKAPWEPGVVVVIADAVLPKGDGVVVSPRKILSDQIDRLEKYGYRALIGTELEFMVFNESYQSAWKKRYSELQPASRFNSDYSLTGMEGLDSITSRMRQKLEGSGYEIESARGELHPGQYEISCKYQEGIKACDGHAVLKLTTKMIAAQEGQSVTFMPKFDDGEGNACHFHFSLRDLDGRLVFPSQDSDRRMSTVMQSFIAGQLFCMRDFMLLNATTINSYKRLASAPFAPKSASWGLDDRLRAIRVVGYGESLRFEVRTPGGDANPYLSAAAIAAAGLYGIENGLKLPRAGSDGARPLPRSLAEALEDWEASSLVPEIFGVDVQNSISRLARAELESFDRVVTDWERLRGFERL